VPTFGSPTLMWLAIPGDTWIQTTVGLSCRKAAKSVTYYNKQLNSALDHFCTLPLVRFHIRVHKFYILQHDDILWSASCIGLKWMKFLENLSHANLIVVEGHSNPMWKIQLDGHLKRRNREAPSNPWTISSADLYFKVQHAHGIRDGYWSDASSHLRDMAFMCCT